MLGGTMSENRHGGEAALPLASLDHLLRPASVAVIGASNRPGSVGGELFANLIASGFVGAVYPVNLHARFVRSVRAYATIGDVPDAVEMAVVAVPREQVLPVVEACAARGVKALVIISAGFAETGPVGAALQERITACVRQAGMRLVGPNCLGVLNTDPEVRLNATFAPTWPRTGNVGFLSQSGALGVAILDHAETLGIGVRQFVSVGNRADVSGNDLLEYWERDPSIRVVLLYLESFGEPRRFMEIARRTSRSKPVIAVKSGRTEAGARAASSHTGSLAGLDVAVDALLGQAGVIRTDTLEEMFDMAILLANQPVPRGNRVAILTNAGGPGIMASDACESRGLALPSLSPGTVAELRAFLPDEASLRNPVDMLAAAGAEAYERGLRLLLADEQIDAVIVLFVPPMFTEATTVAAAIRRAAAGAGKPVLTSFMGTHGVPEALSSLREGRFPSYAFPEAAALALVRAVRYGRWLARGVDRAASLSGVDADAGRKALVAGAGGWLAHAEVERLLAAYGVRTARSMLVRDGEEAVAAAEAIGYPVAVKLASPAVTHKTEVGGVVVGVADANAVREAVGRIRAGLAARGLASELDGVVVQEMVTGGIELFLGATQDPAFGPLLAFGLGGVNVELFRDVVFRVHPIAASDAREMLEEIRGARLLEGFRGAPPADREAVVEALLRVSRMVGELPEIQELDVNPLVALPPGRGVVALDARIRVGE
jgi:acetyl coenzyme A synthetase (ADP forming)-like protein